MLPETKLLWSQKKAAYTGLGACLRYWAYRLKRAYLFFSLDEFDRVGAQLTTLWKAAT